MDRLAEQAKCMVYPPDKTELQKLHDWAVMRLPHITTFGNNYWAIGVVRNRTLAAATIYYNYLKTDIMVAFASDNPRWASVFTIGMFMAYPFLQLGTDRITAIAHVRNKESRKLLEGVGFKHEGTHEDMFYPHKGLSFGLTRRRYLKSRFHERVAPLFKPKPNGADPDGPAVDLRLANIRPRGRLVA